MSITLTHLAETATISTIKEWQRCVILELFQQMMGTDGDSLLSLKSYVFQSAKKHVSQRAFLARFVDIQGHWINHVIRASYAAGGAGTATRGGSSSLGSSAGMSSSLKGGGDLLLAGGMSIAFFAMPIAKDDYLLRKTELSEHPKDDVPRTNSSSVAVEIVFGLIATLYESMVNAIQDRQMQKMVPFRIRQGSLNATHQAIADLLKQDNLWASLIAALNTILAGTRKPLQKRDDESGGDSTGLTKTSSSGDKKDDSQKGEDGGKDDDIEEVERSKKNTLT